MRSGSLIIPDTAKEKPQEGQVIAVGPGTVTDDGKKIPLAVKAGDRILFGDQRFRRPTLESRRVDFGG